MCRGARVSAVGFSPARPEVDPGSKPRDRQEFRNPNPQNQELQEHLWTMLRLAGVLFLSWELLASRRGTPLGDAFLPGR